MQFSVATLAVLATGAMAGSTLYITEEVTITSCAPTVTDCPAQSTVVSMTSYPVITSSAAPEYPTEEYPTEEHPTEPETKTQYTTLLQTITSCAPEKTDCPYGSVTSTVVPVIPTHPAVEYPAGNATVPHPVAPYPTTSPAAVHPTTLVPEVPVAHPTTLVPEVPAVTVTIYECPAETPAKPTKPVEEVPSYPVESKPAEEVPTYPVESKPAGEVPTYPTGGSPEHPVYPTGTGVPTAPHPVYPTGTGAVVPSKTPVFTGAASVNTVSVLAFAGVIAAFFA